MKSRLGLAVWLDHLVPLLDRLFSRQSWMELIAAQTTDGTAHANNTTETIIVPNQTIPANYMQDGRALRYTASGRYGTSGTPTLTFFLRWGGVAGTILAQTGAIVTGSGLSTAQWWIELIIQTRTNGASGSLFVQGFVITHEDAVVTQGTVTNYGAVSPMGSAGVQTPAAVTVDLTADTALALSADWSAASTSNTIQSHIALLESLN